MAAEVLADTGALLAIVDSSDSWHSSAVARLRDLRFPMRTSEAVLTELFYMVGSHRRQMDAVWNLIRSGALELLVITKDELPTVEALMAKHADRPMDFADATPRISR